MKTRTIWGMGAALFALGLGAGCTTPAERRPVVVYPVSYDVPVGNTQVSASGGAQNLNTSSTQQVTAEVDEPLYYRIDSPVPVTVSIYERSDPDRPRVLLRTFQGRAFAGSVVPSEPHLEFVFAARRANTAGTLDFTLSDRPLPPAVNTVNPIPEPPHLDDDNGF